MMASPMTLLSGELFKARKRPAFWVITIGIATILCLIFFGRFFLGVREELPDFALPNDWTMILVGPVGTLVRFFYAVLLILLISNEFIWKTARQNVIDGLSKPEFFLGKLMMIPVLALIFLGLQVVLGVAWAAPGTDFFGGSVVWAGHLKLTAGHFVSMVGYGSLAFLAAFLTRSPGPAMGLYFLYIAVIEPIVVTLLLLRESLRDLIVYVPSRLFGAMENSVQYGLGVALDPNAIVTEFQNQLVAPLSLPEVFWIGSLYVFVFVSLAYLSFRKRDL